MSVGLLDGSGVLEDDESEVVAMLVGCGVFTDIESELEGGLDDSDGFTDVEVEVVAMLVGSGVLTDVESEVVDIICFVVEGALNDSDVDVSPDDDDGPVVDNVLVDADPVVEPDIAGPVVVVAVVVAETDVVVDEADAEHVAETTMPVSDGVAEHVETRRPLENCARPAGASPDSSSAGKVPTYALKLYRPQTHPLMMSFKLVPDNTHSPSRDNANVCWPTPIGTV